MATDASEEGSSSAGGVVGSIREELAPLAPRERSAGRPARAERPVPWRHVPYVADPIVPNYHVLGPIGAPRSGRPCLAGADQRTPEGGSRDGVGDRDHTVSTGGRDETASRIEGDREDVSGVANERGSDRPPRPSLEHEHPPIGVAHREERPVRREPPQRRLQRPPA